MTYDIKNSPLYKLSNKRKLAFLLHSNLPTLTTIVKNIDDHYDVYEISQKNKKKKRQIEAPSQILKTIQKRIKILLSNINTSKFLISGKKGKSFVDNAKMHVNNAYMRSVDIEKFYPSVSKQHIFTSFAKRFMMSEDVAWLLVDLVCYKTVLPTGAPCSQVVAYWAYERVFEKVYKYSSTNNITISLYVDDMIFSSSRPIPKNFIKNVKRMLKNVGLELNLSKTECFPKGTFKKATGCAISPSKKLKVPLDKRRDIEKNIELIYSDMTNYKLIRSVFGKISSARQIEPNYHTKKYEELKSLVKNIKK